MKIIFFLLIILFFPFFSNSQVLKFKALKAQIILNDKYGNYMLAGDEVSIGNGGLDVEINLNNKILHIANNEAGNFNINSLVENYKDSFSNNWTIFQCLDKDGNSCIVRLRFDESDNRYNSYLYIDYKSKIIVYKMKKDSSE